MPNGIAAHADPHGHDHAHHPALQHHFQTLAQQQEAATLGMWVFLVTEVMFFGGLLMAAGAFTQVQQSLRWFVDNAGLVAFGPDDALAQLRTAR